MPDGTAVRKEWMKSWLDLRNQKASPSTSSKTLFLSGSGCDCPFSCTLSPGTVSASATKRDLLQPKEATCNAAARSCIFLIDYRHSNMMHSVTSISLVFVGVFISSHHAARIPRLYRRGAAAVHLIPYQSCCFFKKKKRKRKMTKT